MNINSPKNIEQNNTSNKVSSQINQLNMNNGILQIHIVENDDQVAEVLCSEFKEDLQSHPDGLNLVIPTGSTPKKFYQRLSQTQNEEFANLDALKVFRVEGFLGLDSEHEKSFDGYIKRKFFNAIGVTPDANNFYPLESIINIEDIDKAEVRENALQNYDQTIKQLGGLHKVILGVGGDAHIGDIQPHDMQSFSKLISTRATRAMDIGKDFDEYTQEVFKQDYSSVDLNTHNQFATLGLRVMAQAEELVFVATGAKKAKAIKEGLLDALKRANTSETHNMSINIETQLTNQAILNTLEQQKKEFDYVTPLGFLIHLATKRGAKVKILIDQAAASELN